ncbi:MAG: carboxypeptidase regulatory-like domain-containing protein, partial [Acidobacteria bacterium]|nr:carboxypeptidase regulatory-like domain-containing protein [Acidobacteriota bacterium]
MGLVRFARFGGTALAGALLVASSGSSLRAAGTITGVVFEDFNGNGRRDLTNAVANSGAVGSVALAVDRGVAGIVVTAYDAAGVVQGTALTAANGTYALSAAGTGRYRIEFTNLPAGYRPSAAASGATGNGTTVQFVDDGITANVNLGILDAASFCQNNPNLVTSCFVYGAAGGAFAANPAVVDFPYAAGSSSGANAASYNLPSTHALAVPVSQVGAVYGLGYRPDTNTLYAGAFMKKHSGFGSGGTGAIYAIDATSGVTTLFADLNTIFGAGTAGADPHNTADYDRDNGNASWDAVGKMSLGGVEVSPDGAHLYVMNLADRRVYRLPTSGLLDASTVQRVQIPLNAPGATGPGGADLRPFALQFYRGRLYVGIVNSAESAGATVADLRAYVYTLDPVTLVFSAAPVLQFPLNYPRGAVQTFDGTGPGAWNRWVPAFATQSPSDVGTYPQPMLTGLTFDVSGNLTLGLRDRAGDQFGFFALDNPASSTTWEGVAGGDTLFAAITTPGDLSSGWTLESNAQAGAFGPTAGANNGEGPGPGPGPATGYGEYYFDDAFGAIHRELSGGAVLQLPGHPDVVSSAFDAGLTVRTGGFIWLSETAGSRTKGYNLYDTGFGAPPQPTFSKANGFGELVPICQAAPIEVGNRVWDDLDGDGVQDPNEAGLDGVTVQLIAPGGAVLATAVTANGGQYYFSSGGGTTTGEAIYNVAGLTANTAGFRVRIDAAQGALGGRSLTASDSDASANGDSRDSDGVTAGSNAEAVFTTGTAGANNHTYDFGFTTAPLANLSLGDLVWYDTNNNGAVDSGELPIGGVDVTLYRDDGNGTFDATVDTLIGTQATSGSGLYLFTGLLPGNYFVQISQAEFAGGQPLSGYQNSSGQTAGDTNNADHGAAAPVAGQGIASDLVTLSAGGEPTNDGDGANSNLTIDFGFYRLSLGNLVFNDANNSGSFDPGDTPRDGVTVDLLDAAGVTVLATTTTASGGLYSFTGLTPGDYRVRITTPTGLTSSTGGSSEPALDPDNDVDNDDNGTTSGAFIVSGPVTLAPGSEPDVTNATGESANTRVDFGLIVATLSLGNLVWFDTNNNGIVDGGEGGAAGVTVRLIAADGMTVLQTTTTDGSGLYLFSGLPPGTYYVDVVPPPGATSSTDIASSAAPNNDMNNDDNGVTFIGGAVRSGPITLGAGTEPTNDGDTNADSNLTVDFGFVPSGVLSLGNLVWLDVNNNGLADSGEPGLAGVTVRLIAANGSTVLSTTTTDASGNYLFSTLPAGTYIVEVDRTSSAVTGYLSSTDIASSATPDNDVNNDDNGIAVTPTAVRSAPVTLSTLAEPVTDGDSDPNSNLSVDFGFVRALSLGNLVWADVNNNGLVDPGETGIGGVTVRLIAADGVTVLQTTTTDASGHYLFGGLPPGTYYVEVVPPSGSQSSTDIASSAVPNNDVDNDDNGVTAIGGVVRSGPITLGVGTEPTSDGDTNPDSNLTVDFGFVPPLGGGLVTDICLQQAVPANVAPGGLMTATYTATNRGPGSASDVIIDGMLPPGVTVVSTTPSPGGVCTVTPSMLDCRWLGTTPAGPSGLRQVTVVFQVAATVPPGTPLALWFMTSSSNPDPYPACNMVDAYVFVSGGPVAPVDMVIRAAVSAAGATGTTVAAALNQPVAGRFTVTNPGASPARGRYVILLDEAGVVEVTSAAWSQGWAGVSTATAGVWETDFIAPGGSATLDLGLVPRVGTAAKIQAIRIDGAPADPNADNDRAEFVIDAVGTGGGRFVAVGNVDGAAGGEIVTGNGQGETPQVRVFSGAGGPLADFYAFDRTFLGGVRVASCDVNGDGRDEILAAQGPGGGRVRVLSLAGGVLSELVAFDAFESGFAGGVNVACADLDLDGRGDVVVGPDGGRAPDVKVFTVGALSAVVTAQFQAYEPTFTGGVRVSVGRFAGSGVVGAFNI